MEGTCTYPKCPHAKLTEQLAELAGVKTEFPKECSNYIEAWWTDENNKQQKIMQDCAPRRTLWMVQDLFNRQIGLQKAQEEQRNASDQAMATFIQFGRTIGLKVIESADKTIPGNGRTLIETKSS